MFLELRTTNSIILYIFSFCELGRRGGISTTENSSLLVVSRWTAAETLPVSCCVHRRTRRNVWLPSPSLGRAVGPLPRDQWTQSSAEPVGGDTWHAASETRVIIKTR